MTVSSSTNGYQEEIGVSTIMGITNWSLLISKSKQGIPVGVVDSVLRVKNNSLAVETDGLSVLLLVDLAVTYHAPDPFVNMQVLTSVSIKQ